VDDQQSIVAEDRSTACAAGPALQDGLSQRHRDQHPMHLHRHTFEVTRVGTKEFSGLRKDVVNVMPLDSVAVDFVADNPGDTLLHCHQALYMDFGFMQLMKSVG
jgi:FtsP/CotA-like multicopper oxidase with cupredoxin domain